MSGLKESVGEKQPLSNYIISNGELYHYGVKGMKWGVRRYQNKDGSLTEAGKKRAARQFAKEYYKDTKNAGHAFRKQREMAESKELSEIYDSKEVSDALQKYKDSTKLYREYSNNGKLVAEYQKVAAKKMSEKYGMDYEECLYMYTEEDADQGETSSFIYYLKDKGISPKQYESDAIGAAQNYKKTCNDATTAYMKQYGKTPMVEVYTTDWLTGRPRRRLTTLAEAATEALDWRGFYEMFDD